MSKQKNILMASTFLFFTSLGGTEAHAVGFNQEPLNSTVNRGASNTKSSIDINQNTDNSVDNTHANIDGLPSNDLTTTNNNLAISSTKRNPGQTPPGMFGNFSNMGDFDMGALTNSRAVMSSGNSSGRGAIGHVVHTNRF